METEQENNGMVDQEKGKDQEVVGLFWKRLYNSGNS